MSAYDERLEPMLAILPVGMREQFGTVLQNGFAQLSEGEQEKYLRVVPVLQAAIESDDCASFCAVLATMGYGDYAPLLWGMVRSGVNS